MRQIILDEYLKVMETVCRHYGLDEVQMLHSNKDLCVDARATIIGILTEKGLTESDLVELTGLTQQCVNKLKSSVRIRENRWSFRETMKCIKLELYPTTCTTDSPHTHNGLFFKQRT